ncbi:MAG: metallophosphoesterase, partial [Deltaproteobacteria bacterium]
KNRSIFNFVAVGDWDCTDETEDTVDNSEDQDPELVLALGDLSYNGDADCWLDLIEPIADKTKIVMGNHEEDLIKDYMDFFGLQEEYYSFNYKNIHFLALSTQTDYDDDSEQYQFAIRDLEKYSKDPFIDWIIVYYHHFIYGSGPYLEEETDFRETYHPLFDKYKVDLALQGHLHVYERTYPITFNNKKESKPIVQDYNPDIYKNPKGTVFVTVGTGGAQDMILSSLRDFSAQGIDGKFGILDIALENARHTLTGTFIENGKKKEILDEFKIVK